MSTQQDERMEKAKELLKAAKVCTRHCRYRCNRNSIPTIQHQLRSSGKRFVQRLEPEDRKW